MSREPSSRRQSTRYPSILDVAQHAGVSGQTVSRVSNGVSNVSAETRARVLKSMDRLGYVPNNAARSLRGGKTRVIGVVEPLAKSTRWLQMFAAIETRAMNDGYTTAMVPPTTHAIGTSPAAAIFGCSGVLVFDRARPESTASSASAQLPTLWVDPGAGEVRGRSRWWLGGHLATGHLLGLRHPTVWHVSGPMESYWAAQIEDGWRNALNQSNKTAPEPLRGDWSARSGYSAGQELVKMQDVSAIFAASDEMALGVLRALHESGRDVSVVGLDGSEDAQYFWPPLTTVDVDIDGIAAWAVRTVINMIERSDQEVGLTHDVHLELGCSSSVFGSTFDDGNLAPAPRL